MGAAAVKSWASIAAAILGVAFIAGLSLWGERDRGGLEAFESKGFLAQASVGVAREVELEAAGRRRGFLRAGDGWQGGQASTVALLEGALALTRDAAPERNLTEEEIAGTGLAVYGLAPPGLTVTVKGDGFPVFRMRFGGTNPLGLSRYAQVDGRPGIWLVPGHLARAWEETMGGP